MNYSRHGRHEGARFQDTNSWYRSHQKQRKNDEKKDREIVEQKMVKINSDMERKTTSLHLDPKPLKKETVTIKACHERAKPTALMKQAALRK